MNCRVRPEAKPNSKPDFGSINFTCLCVRQFIGDMELLMYQQQQRVAELEDKQKLNFLVNQITNHYPSGF